MHRSWSLHELTTTRISSSRCGNQTDLWKRLEPEADVLSIETNSDISPTRKTSQVRSQVTFHKPQHVTVRCEALDSDGVSDRRDVKLVSSSRCRHKASDCHHFLGFFSSDIVFFLCCSSLFSSGRAGRRPGVSGHHHHVYHHPHRCLEEGEGSF